MEWMNVERVVEGLPLMEPGRTRGTIWHAASNLDSIKTGGISSVQCSLMAYHSRYSVSNGPDFHTFRQTTFGENKEETFVLSSGTVKSGYFNKSGFVFDASKINETASGVRITS